ncbi:MAG: C45 family peptidase [Saprospiraceae bacterium]
MQLEFRSIAEVNKPGEKWLEIYKTFWPGYRAWLLQHDFQNTVSLEDSEAALKQYMPKMLPTYKRLCSLVKNDALATKFLTGFQPPAYISACAQAVTKKDSIQLVRNYDYSPGLLEGICMNTKWNKKKVLGTNDCLIGLVDGINEDGLAISLTFGGRKEVGRGFGIPFIIRYVLEFCKNVDQAVKCLTTIPSHMSYNVIVVDKKGHFKTVMVAPDREAIVTNHAFSTNHQLKVEWEENARFNKTIERSNFLEDALEYKDLTNDKLASIFLLSPMYNTKFKEGFGTLYTAVYRPETGEAEWQWKGQKMKQSFSNFEEQQKLILFPSVIDNKQVPVVADIAAVEIEPNWQSTVAEILANSMVKQTDKKSSKKIKFLQDKLLQAGEISWEVITDYWKNFGTHQTKK